jgi:ankyrin repeat protein
MAKILLSLGAKVDSRDKDMDTPLHFAAWQGHIGFFKVLIENGADINAIGMNGWVS